MNALVMLIVKILEISRFVSILMIWHYESTIWRKRVLNLLLIPLL